MSDPKTTLNRWKLAALWTSQSLHFFANYGLRIAVVLHLAATDRSSRDAAFHLSAAIFMAPSILLVPLYGALGNSLPKRVSLAASAAFCAAVTVGLAASQTGWLLGLGLVAMGSALYAPTRYAMLPAAANDADWPLQRILSAIEAGSVLSMVSGMLACAAASTVAWSDFGIDLSTPPPALALLAAAHVASFALALCVWFPSDVYRPESPRSALAGFGRDAARIWRIGAARGTLLGLASLRAVVTAAAGAFVARALEESGGDTGGAFRALLGVAIVSILGAAVGAILAGIARSPERILVFVPIGVSGMCGAMIWAGVQTHVPLAMCFLVGVGGGFVNVPLLTVFQKNLPADARGNGMALLGTAGFAAMTFVSAALALLAKFAHLAPTGQIWLVAAMAALGCILAWFYLWPRAAARKAVAEASDYDSSTSPV